MRHLACSPSHTSLPKSKPQGQQRQAKARLRPRRAGSEVIACLRCQQARAQPLVAARPPLVSRQLHACATPAQQQQEEPVAEVTKAVEGVGNDRDAPATSEAEQSLGVRAALSLLRFYKNGISPLLPPSCRYIPTCSAYAMDAYQQYGVGKGTVLTAWRLMRCSPLGSSGYDPVQWPPPGLGWLLRE